MLRHIAVMFVYSTINMFEKSYNCGQYTPSCYLSFSDSIFRNRRKIKGSRDAERRVEKREKRGREPSQENDLSLRIRKESL